jgi:hypothetical protein
VQALDVKDRAIPEGAANIPGRLEQGQVPLRRLPEVRLGSGLDLRVLGHVECNSEGDIEEIGLKCRPVGGVEVVEGP